MQTTASVMGSFHGFLSPQERPSYIPPRTVTFGPDFPSHLLNLPWLLHGQAQQFVSCNLHEEGVENPNLFRVDVPDEGRLFPETLSHLGGWGQKRDSSR